MSIQSNCIQIGDAIVNPYSVDPSILRIARHGKKQWELLDGSVSSVENAVLDRFKDEGYSGYFTGRYDLKSLLVTLAAWSRPFDDFDKIAYVFGANRLNRACVEGEFGKFQTATYNELIESINSFSVSKLRERFKDFFKSRPQYKLEYHFNQHLDFGDLEEKLVGFYRHYDNDRMLHEVEEKCPLEHVIHRKKVLEFCEHHVFRELANRRGHVKKNLPFTDEVNKYIQDIQPKISIDLVKSSYAELADQSFICHGMQLLEFPGDYWSKTAREYEEIFIHNRNFLKKIKDKNIKNQYNEGLKFMEKAFYFERELRKKTELDLCIWNENEYYEIEVKAPKDSLRKNQRHTIIDNNESGIVSFVVNVIEK